MALSTLTRVGLMLVASVGLTGCSLISPNDPEPVRFFTPPLDGFSVSESTGRVALRLRPVVAAEHLRQPMVWRLSPVELGYDDLERWAEEPARFVERALAAGLYGDSRFRRSLTGSAPGLEVSLYAFEEVLAPEHVAEIRLTAVLTTSRGESLLEQSYLERVGLDSDDPAELAQAMGKALTAIATALAGDVEKAMPRVN